MASQFDELRLQVSLVDNATAQLKSIKSSLDELGTGSQANNLDRLKRETGEVDAALRKMVDTALRGPKAFLDLARSVTVAGVSLGTFAYAAEKTLGTVGALSSKLVELLHISRQTGFDPAVIKQITQAYERSGLSARQAQQEMAGFSSSLADFAQINSKVRQGIEAGFGNQKELIGQFRQMYDAIDRAPDTISKFNTIKDHANAIFEQFKGKGQEPLGKIIRDRILDQFKIPGALNVTDAIKPVTDAMSAHLKKQIASAEEYEKVTIRISQNWTAIANTMKFDVMNSGLIKGLKWLDEFMEKWKKAAQAAPKSADDKARGVASQRPPSAPVSRPPGSAPYSPRSGIPPKPQQLLGDGGVSSGGGGRADMSSIPSLTDALKSLPAGKSEQSNFAGTGWRGLPISTNVDDQRGQNLLETQNDETKTLIGELRRLNALLAGEERPQGQKYGALAMPGGGRAGIPGASGYPRGGGPPGGNPPGSSGNPPPTTPGGTPPPIPGPYGQPMPPWGTTTAGFGGGTGGGSAGGVPGLPGSPSGPALTKEQRQAAAGGGGGADTGGGNEGLAADRAKLMGEINRDPALRARIADVLGHETHGDQKGAQAVMETMINRALRLGHTSLWQTISKKDDKIPGSGFYGPVNRNELRGASANDLKIADEATRRVAGGSNITDFRDDQGTNARGQPEVPRAGSGVTRIGDAGPNRGEHFYYSGPAAVAWANKQREKYNRTGGPKPTQNVSTPQIAPGAPGGGGVIDYSKMSGARSNEGGMEEYIEYAARKAGVNVQVAHGIEGKHKRHRPGAPSYDLDLKDPETGRRLDMANQNDHAKIASFIEHSAAGGGTGIGAGYVYMGGKRFHIGGGNPAVWGDDLVRAGAPKWVIDAYERGRARQITPQQRTAELARLRKEQETKVAGPGAGTGAPPAPTATTPPDNPATSLYDKLRKLEEAHRAQQKTSIDLKAARDRIDRMNAAQKVAGTGDITVKVKPERTRTGSSGILKKVPMNRLTQGDKASPGPSQPTAATGASHDPSLDS